MDANLSIPGAGGGGGWTEVYSQKKRRPSTTPSVHGELLGVQSSGRRAAFTTDPARLAFLSKLSGRFFRCLSSRHRLSDCRDPISCLTCRRGGHISCQCPQNPKNKGRAGSARNRLGRAPPSQPLHSRLCFPPPTATTMSSIAPSLLQHADPARRPRDRRSVTIPSPAIHQAASFLCTHAITLRVAGGVNATSPMAVGRALEAHLSVPVHSLRVTAHHLEHYFVVFAQPALQVNDVRRGSIRVDGTVFNISSWHEHDHASFHSLLLHVRVVIEGVLMHY
ncbi:hypothetical protein D1007_12260 [Hordeum vulgare]|nr:hypothetical protein D1007_12260 [Hordeum vulgare]